MANLATTLAEATRLGFVGFQFDTRLAIGEIEMKAGRVGTGRARLAALEKDATEKGFLLTAHNAARLAGT